VNDAAEAISSLLVAERPLDALRTYEGHMRSAGAEALRTRFGPTMNLLRLAYDLDFEQLSLRHAQARKEERRRVRQATVQRILELADDERRLKRTARRLPRLVLDGTLQQQFCSKLAATFTPDLNVPDTVRDTIVASLIEALGVVLRVGAPTTRDAAIEGLGALLQRVDAVKALPEVPVLNVERGKEEKRDDYTRRARISKEYFSRLERRRLMALTIAGEPDARALYAVHARDQLAAVLQRIRRQQRRMMQVGVPLDDPGKEAKRLARHARVSTRRIEDALYERADFLRILPAVARQSGGEHRLPVKPTKLLIDAALPLPIGEDDPDDVRIAYARYQETLFRTLDVAMDRGWKWGKFDEFLAAAVRSIPQTIAGSPAVSNAQIRATVAILRTAARVVKVSGGASAVKEPLAELFKQLDEKVTKWTNPGIAEGCYRAIPQLVGEPAFTEMLRPALLALYNQMKRVPAADDLVRTHRRLVANSSFRRILVSLTDHLHERQLFETEADALRDQQSVERNLRLVLASPTPENIHNVCQHTLPPEVDHAANDVDELVVAGIAFESDLLHRARVLFRDWSAKPTADKVLLTRILATQLHAISRDAPELARHPLLRRVFLGLPSIALSDAEAMAEVWRLLSVLPPDAAQTADVEIQRFVEYRGGRTGEPGRRDPTDDLPGYVLAMIDPAATHRIAGGIAREIDLRRRREQRTTKSGFARILYQVTLRGPHESIFDHLLPRVENADARRIVLLFRQHVASVRRSFSDGKLDLAEIREHVNALLEDLRPREENAVLNKLRTALTYFRNLIANSNEPGQTVWDSLARRDGTAFLEKLDELAEAADPEEDRPRRLLMPIYERRMSDLQEQAEHYVDLDAGQFDARIQALKKAADAAQAMEAELAVQPGLEPPERHLLVGLMQHLRDLFDRTRRWFCEQPRQDMEGKDVPGFWLFYCDPRPIAARIGELEQQINMKYGDLWARADAIKRRDALRNRQQEEPPPVPHQWQKFRDLFVKWRESDLDITTLKTLLKRDWFRLLYSTVTNFKGISAVILAPCVWAVGAHLYGNHKLEGAGFFIVAALMIGITVVSLVGAVHFVTRMKERKDLREQQTDEQAASDYRYASLLPRLARLIAVPMTLTVEFDHSYEFPMEASTWALLLLMVLSYLTTRFFVTREIVEVRKHPGPAETTEEDEKKDVKKRAAQIVALALAHSFAIAVLLSAIFASSFEYPQTHREHEDGPHASLVALIDAPSPPEHPYPAFLGVLQREVELDLRAVWTAAGGLGEHAVFRFYPTIILTWTALGLFFGAFLEGFMSGKRLRGGEAEARDAGH
jgi:hypothetical protein